jgi:hypothetical protein
VAIGVAVGVGYEWWTNSACADWWNYLVSGGIGAATGLTGLPVAALGGRAAAAGWGFAGRGAAADFVAGYTGGIGRSGLLGQSYLGSRISGTSQQGFRTPFGRRVIDRFGGGVGHESKVGATSLTNAIRQQIAKDAWLTAKNVLPGGATWHFFASPVTGLGGPSGPLLNALTSAGIRVVIH